MSNTWCMRMEAKNGYFKQILRIGNFKNLPFSVAHRHQRLLCANLQDKFFLYDHLECGPCKFNFNHVYAYMYIVYIQAEGETS